MLIISKVVQAIQMMNVKSYIGCGSGILIAKDLWWPQESNFKLTYLGEVTNTCRYLEVKAT